MTGSNLPTLKPGDGVPSRRHLITQDLIARYAHVSGDHNPLHLDPEFAKTTRFGRIIAHGMMTLAFVSQAMSEVIGAEWETRGFLAVTFVAPVFVGDEVEVRIEVETSTEADIACKVECWTGDRLTLAGAAGTAAEHDDG